jgi:hypothetical protein
VGLRDAISAPAFEPVGGGLARAMGGGYQIEYIYSYLASCCQNWNLALCVGFSLWYTLIPSVLLTVTSYSEDLLKPEILSAADRMISDWLEHIRQIFYHLYEGVYGGGREEGAQGIINNSSPVRQENLSWERGHGQTLTEGSLD